MGAVIQSLNSGNSLQGRPDHSHTPRGHRGVSPRDPHPGIRQLEDWAGTEMVTKGVASADGRKTILRNFSLIRTEQGASLGAEGTSFSEKGQGGQEREFQSLGRGMNFSEAWQPGKHRAGFCFPPQKRLEPQWEGGPTSQPAGRALAKPRMQTLCCRQEGSRASSDAHSQASPGTSGLCQLGPEDAVFGRNWQLEGRRRNRGRVRQLGWPPGTERGSELAGLPAKGALLSPKRAQAKHNSAGRGTEERHMEARPSTPSGGQPPRAPGSRLPGLHNRFHGAWCAVTTASGWPGAGQCCGLQAGNRFPSAQQPAHFGGSSLARSADSALVRSTGHSEAGGSIEGEPGDQLDPSARLRQGCGPTQRPCKVPMGHSRPPALLFLETLGCITPSN